MNRMLALLGGGILAAGLGVGGAIAHDGPHKEGEKAKTATIQGELVDAACFIADGGNAKGKGHLNCAKKCMASGIPAGILPEGGKDAKAMMFLLTNPTVLAPHAAKTIKVEGTAHADMRAIDVKKLFVKDGEKWTEVQLKDEHHKASGEGHGDHKDHEHKDHK
jgi:hypothetical protein